jgi:hypothetical protein
MTEVSLFINDKEEDINFDIPSVPRIGEEIELNVNDVRGLFRVENVRHHIFDMKKSLMTPDEKVVRSYVKLYITPVVVTKEETK